MKVSQTKHFIKVTGEDVNGDFSIEIQNDCSQLRISTGDGDSYIDTSSRELRIIRDAITKALEGMG
jgi:hypothetical protein